MSDFYLSWCNACCIKTGTIENKRINEIAYTCKETVEQLLLIVNVTYCEIKYSVNQAMRFKSNHFFTIILVFF